VDIIDYFFWCNAPQELKDTYLENNEYLKKYKNRQVQVQQIDLNDEIPQKFFRQLADAVNSWKNEGIYTWDSQPKQLKASSPPLAIQFIKKDLIGKII
jgi:hypothetical protein